MQTILVLVGIHGNAEILIRAVERAPSLLIDCSNCADAHQLFPFVDEEQLKSIYVIEVELLYLLRDVLKRTDAIARGIGAKCILVTQFSYLFSYNDEDENKNLLEHCWKLLRRLADSYEVIVGIHESYEELAKEHCDTIKDEQMGHTVISQRMNLDNLLSELSDYGKSLRREDRAVFERLLKQPLKHVGSISHASSFHAWAFLILSILLEQEKRCKHECLADGCLQEKEQARTVDQNT
jgi:hypothetical protein